MKNNKNNFINSSLESPDKIWNKNYLNQQKSTKNPFLQDSNDVPLNFQTPLKLYPLQI